MLRAQRRATAGLAVALIVGLALAGCGTPEQTVTAREASASAAAASSEAGLTETTPSVRPTMPPTLSASGTSSAPVPAPSPSGPAPTAAPSPQPSDGVLVTGEVAAPFRLTLDALAALPQRTLDVSYQGANGPESPSETGPLLIDVLDQVGLRTDPAKPDDILNLAVVVLGSNGRQATLSLGEISPDFAAVPPILSLAENGVAVPDGPMLVVPADVHNGRYVPSVVELRVVRLA